MAAVAAFGAELWLGDPLVKIANVLSVSPPGKTRETIDASDHDSPDGMAEYVASGIVRLSPITITIHRFPGSAAEDILHDALDSGEQIGFEVREKRANGIAAAKWATRGDCFVVGYEPGTSEVEGKLTDTLTLQPTGALVREEVTTP
jgi:hypothetical protein